MPRPDSLTNILPVRDLSDVGRRLREMQAEIDALKTARPYGMASRNFDGTMDPAAAGSHGWALTPAGVAILQQLIMSGDLRITGGSLVVENGGSIEIDDDGTFMVKYSNGQIAVLAGFDAISGDVGFGIARPDGSVSFSADSSSGGFVAIHDHDGNVIVSDDEVSGHGVATPYIPAGTFVDLTPPAAATSAGAFTSLQWADVYVQHPKVTCAVLALTPSGTAGELRMTVGGVQIGAVQTVPSASFTIFYFPPVVWPSWPGFTSRQLVVLEGRVTSGAGAISARGVGLWGVQS